MNQATSVDVKTLAEGLARADRSCVANALNLIDDKRPGAHEQALQLLTAIDGERLNQGGHLIGITGPPGAGKSSLLSALLERWCHRGLQVAVLAVDPSSPKTGGALLGDRLRMSAAGQHKNLFIRSLASRQQLGGLAPEVWPMSRALLAGYDLVLVETVGVGQSEIDVANIVDTTVYVVQPASGDSIQFLKSGIMEVPDIMVVNKSDLGSIATKAANELTQVLHRSEQHTAWQRPVCKLSARDREGIDALEEALKAHRDHLRAQNSLTSGRMQQQVAYIIRQLNDEFGSHGIKKLGGSKQIAAHCQSLHGTGQMLASYNAWVEELRR
ncbi:MAG: methylmalonyl Co-A mutase-associated GTPase MeaB [Gammaproteobacteria bacterium]|nr:methylmalonyl Co-A mutase-associated GTPase MeaB [Gammaproteobacteria bacterium]MBT8151104.1 methylmalonyl Co-A mutase-associated GTPase MeaB [Gammaproteobacteria bacterium]NND38807.1 methylmalonyl Co-A mutase-associated GTPase MeaB [Pseudomonadales bacterium]NNM10425.1 methylmalonyl Co-A mutase-associated GTPase MeaB [Pseudomonadales bacterium]RZV58522.1 MAG: methylmalonyl Co-A mutase-associated GTPase MeaB [Pseudomonadales bacterium]